MIPILLLLWTLAAVFPSWPTFILAVGYTIFLLHLPLTGEQPCDKLRERRDFEGKGAKGKGGNTIGETTGETIGETIDLLPGHGYVIHDCGGSGHRHCSPHSSNGVHPFLDTGLMLYPPGNDRRGHSAASERSEP